MARIRPTGINPGSSDAPEQGHDDYRRGHVLKNDVQLTRIVRSSYVDVESY